MNLKIRVRPFSQSGRWYIIEYKKPGFLSSWRRINTAVTCYSDPRHNHCSLPLLIDDFDEAVKQARGFKTLADVTAYEAAEMQKFREAQARIVPEFEHRLSQSWSSE